jgi:sRNA-binding protein
MTANIGLSDTLRRWCSRPAYLESFTSAAHRIGLDGEPTTPITDVEREHAAITLNATTTEETKKCKIMQN